MNSTWGVTGKYGRAEDYCKRLRSKWDAVAVPKNAPNNPITSANASQQMARDALQSLGRTNFILPPKNCNLGFGFVFLRFGLGSRGVVKLFTKF